MSNIDLHRRLHDRLPEYAHEYIAGALAGDIEAVGYLIVSAPNQKRPMVLLALHHHHGPGHPAVRAALEDVWSHDHDHMIADLGRQVAWQLLKQNGTPPSGLPRTITLYRGGVGHPGMIRSGWSWSTDKRVAAFFCEFWQRRSPVPGPSCVVSAEVRTDRIVHTSNERTEAEMVIFGAKNAVVDGAPAEWARLADELVVERKRGCRHDRHP